MKCDRVTCHRKSHRKGLCHAHYYAYRQTRPVGRIDIQPVREHLQRLFEAGMTHDRISQLAGVSRRSAIKRAFDPGRKYILAVTAAKILAVPVPAFPTPSKQLCKWIPSLGTTRRLQSLIAIGYRQMDLQAHLGVCQQTMTDVVNGCRSGVRTDFAQRVDVMFREFQLKPQTDVKSIRRAARRGWPPPFAWGDDIDDPAAVPDVGEVGDFLDFVADARELNYSDEKIASVAGLQVDSLQTKIRRLKRQAVA